ncbi:MAG: glutamine-synthetase adenylyltransferase [Pseudomonadota bacterium]
MLKKLDDYKKKQLDEAASSCSAVARYLGFIQQTAQCFEDEIRIERHRHWLKCAMAVFHNTATPSDVCLYWSQSAQGLLQKAWEHFELQTEPIAVYALGKLGAGELNLSSDVDLILLGASKKPQEVLNKIKKFKRSLEQPTELGFALRVDFDLRPDGNWGPLVVSVPMFQDHYWSRGETWERLAFVRLRYLFGDEVVKKDIEDLVPRFCYRKFTDYTLHEDLKSLRSRIHSLKTMPSDERVDLKLTVGGIRDIELYVHSLQVMHGGRVLDVRTQSTNKAIEALSYHFEDKAEKLHFLKENYWWLRDLENKVQIYADEHTHKIERDSHYPDLSGSEFADLRQRMDKINEVVSSLLGNVDVSQSHLPNSLDGQQAWLEELGFDKRSVQETWPEIIRATALSHKKDRDENIRKELLFQFVNILSEKGEKKNLALSFFLDFARSTRAKSTLFALLIREEKLLNLLANAFLTSNYMSQVLTTRPELLDSLVYGHQELPDSLDDALEVLMDRKLISEIRASIDFQSSGDPLEVSQMLSSTADQIALDLKQLVKTEIPGSDFRIFALGKWGTNELSFHSDLDFILVKPGQISEQDHKAARRFINYLRSPQRGGKIYDIDMRLRPSGSSGPLLVTLDRFYEYMRKEAQAWERQSYLKLRPLDQSLELDLSAVFSRSLSPSDIQELKDIRKRLLRKQEAGEIDLKYARGGLVDVELGVQSAILASGLLCTGSTLQLCNCLAKAQPKDAKSFQALSENYLNLRKAEQAYRLATQNSELLLNKDKESINDTALILNESTDSLWNSLTACLQHNCELLKELDPIYSGK